MIHAESLTNDKSSIVWHHMGLGGTKCLRKQLAFGPKVQYFLELNSKKKKKKKKSNSRIYSERISKKRIYSEQNVNSAGDPFTWSN